MSGWTEILGLPEWEVSDPPHLRFATVTPSGGYPDLGEVFQGYQLAGTTVPDL